jgi:hypothetical protein
MTQKQLYKLILKDISEDASDKIHPVTVPMLVNNSWSRCFEETYELYKKAKHGKRIEMLAYSYHLGSLVLACPHNKEIPTHPKNRIMWIKIYHLFRTVGYHQIYRTKRTKPKYIYYLKEKHFKQILKQFY